MIRTRCFLLLIVCCNIAAFSSAQELQIQQFTTRDGLPSPYVYGAYEDPNGYLWVATPNGLSRFDGSRFVNYGYSEGLQNVMIGAVMMDSKQRLWVGAKNFIGQLNSNRFKAYPIPDNLDKFYVSQFFEFPNGKLLVCTSAGSFRLAGDHWEKQVFDPRMNGHGCRQVIQNGNTLYINYGDRIIVGLKGSYRTITPVQATEVYYNRIEKFNNRIYVSTIDGVYSLDSEVLHQVPGIAGNLKGIYSFFTDSKERCWIGTSNGGLSVIQKDDPYHMKNVYHRDQVNLISSIREDRQGNIWVGDYEGLVKVSDRNFEQYDIFRIGARNYIRNIIRQPGELWVNDGSFTKFVFGDKEFEKRPLHKNPVLYSPADELIVDGYCTERQYTWLLARGFSLYRSLGDQITDMRGAFPAGENEAFDVLYDQARNHIIAAIGTGKLPAFFDGKTFQPLKLSNPVTIRGIIRRIHQCTNHYILLSTDQGKLYCIDTRDHCYEVWPNKLGVAVGNFVDDPSGDVWLVFSGLGAYRLRWINDSLNTVGVLNRNIGLPNDYFTGFCFDNQGRLWVSTLVGVTVLRKNKNDEYEIIRSYNSSDLGTEMSESSRMQVDNEGKVWLSFRDRLIRFDPSYLEKENASALRVKIEAVDLDLKPTDWAQKADSIEGIFGIPFKPSLSHKNNSLGIHYHAIWSNGLNGVEYSYRLIGFSNEWGSPTKNDMVSFIKLPAGDYHYEVRARMAGTGWSAPAAFEFRIRKPFWDTWLFRFLVTSLMAMMIIFIFRYRLNQVKKRSLLQQQLTEMEMKALKAQMNPHFIYNSLNSIQSLVANGHNDEASRYISQFANLLRQVLNQSDSKLISIEKELKTLGFYVSLESLRLGFEPEISIQMAANIDPATELIPPLTLQPFIENSLWHGFNGKEGRKIININFSINGNFLICQVSDNGIGMELSRSKPGTPTALHESRGIEITRNRLRSFNSDDNDPVTIKDLFNEKNQSDGTMVELKIRRSI